MRTTAWIALSLGLLGPVVDADTLRVVTEDTAYTYLQDGKVAGPASEVVEATLQRAGLHDYQIGLYPWARAYDMALQEPGVLIYLIARTSEREALFRWVGEIMRIEYHFYKMRARDDIQVPDLEVAKAYRIGVLREDVRHHYLQANGFTKIVVSAHNSDNFKRLLNGQVDLVPMPEQDIIALCNEAGVDPGMVEKVFTPNASTRLYMAYSRRTDDETVLRTHAAFEHLRAEGAVARIMAGPH
ncbi:transporter substrate-binding domain-containing protein [Pseudomonas stutzeri]|uniref:substrate-binding periplasmic protein n=1 Tax=Stutzerimonas stutzeri TaxID=316 RepID=UPI002108772F|nr:transporter substrate-binding domain-containing protein [Stutzerimonas stutzeri]MCQ4289225.1 transporter substrate-binding domain-containing protein [Stutzerimonas stutzeri]